MTASPVVSVIIPCMNERRSIARLLSRIAAQQPPPDEIIIVDGGSTDGTIEELARIGPSVNGIPIETFVAPELPLPEAINFAVRQSRGDVVVRLDAHSEPSDGYLAAATRHLQDPSIGVVGGVWHVEPGAPTSVAAAIARAVSHTLGAGDAAYRLMDSQAGLRDVDTVPFGAFRRTTWELVGGFNEQLLGNEDYEFNYQVRKRGLSVRLDANMHCVYFARATLSALARQYFRYGWCKFQMLRLHPRSLRWRQAVPALFVPTLMSGLIMSVPWPLPRVAVAVLVASYVSILLAVAVATVAREGKLTRSAWLPVVFATIHLTWGTGALVHAMTAGRWPRRAFLFGIPART